MQLVLVSCNRLLKILPRSGLALSGKYYASVGFPRPHNNQHHSLPPISYCDATAHTSTGFSLYLDFYSSPNCCILSPSTTMSRRVQRRPMLYCSTVQHIGRVARSSRISMLHWWSIRRLPEELRFESGISRNVLNLKGELRCEEEIVV